jgi:hypothetical protein
MKFAWGSCRCDYEVCCVPGCWSLLTFRSNILSPSSESRNKSCSRKEAANFYYSFPTLSCELVLLSLRAVFGLVNPEDGGNISYRNVTKILSMLFLCGLCKPAYFLACCIWFSVNPENGGNLSHRNVSKILSTLFLCGLCEPVSFLACCIWHSVNPEDGGNISHRNVSRILSMVFLCGLFWLRLFSVEY